MAPPLPRYGKMWVSFLLFLLAPTPCNGTGREVDILVVRPPPSFLGRRRLSYIYPPAATGGKIGTFSPSPSPRGWSVISIWATKRGEEKEESGICPCHYHHSTIQLPTVSVRRRRRRRRREMGWKTDSLALNAPDLLFVLERPTRPDPGFVPLRLWWLMSLGDPAEKG